MLALWLGIGLSGDFLCLKFCFLGVGLLDGLFFALLHLLLPASKMWLTSGPLLFAVYEIELTAL